MRVDLLMGCCSSPRDGGTGDGGGAGGDVLVVSVDGVIGMLCVGRSGEGGRCIDCGDVRFWRLGGVCAGS